MRYTDEQALRILAIGHARRDPEHHKEPMKQALLRLADAVGAIAMQAGYHVSGAADGTVTIVHVGKGTAVLRFTAGAPRIEGSSAFNEPKVNPISLAEVAIEFDPLQGAFIGKDTDPNVEHEPRSIKQRRSAVAVVAEAVVKIIDQQAAQR